MTRASVIVTNKMRYATGKTSPLSSLENAQQLIEFAQPIPEASNHYKIIAPRPSSKQDYRDSSGLLDEEDERLLEKFYRETKNSDPFNEVWDDRKFSELPMGKQNFTDSSIKPNSNDYYHNSKKLSPLNNLLDWSLEPILNFNSIQVPSTISEDPSMVLAKYSPTIKLLTSYDPIGENLSGSDGHQAKGGGSIVGATLFGQDRNRKPEVSSNLAVEAVKLHDELMKPPPKDGKVRVRMYYHRAIHDDNRLYGTGPWKYWGHGWGLEFGFDPKKKESDGKDRFYQKGYTIERAFGRDFCKDKLNCRKPDPEFFKTPYNAGKYTKQQYRAARVNARVDDTMKKADKMTSNVN